MGAEKMSEIEQQHRQRCDTSYLLPAECIQDNENLTQYGNGLVFRDSPREVDERQLSLLRGYLTAQEAFYVIAGRIAPGDGRVRYTTAATLRNAGFDVIHTPAKRNKNHVSVTSPAGDPDSADLDWPPPVRERFGLCFTNDGEGNEETE